MSKVRKGLSYVLGDDNGSENHILPINAMQYSTINKKLYTGGRDGTVKEWNSANRSNDTDDDDEENFRFHTNVAQSNTITNNDHSSANIDVNNNSSNISSNERNFELDQDLDERVLKLETSISSNPLPYCSPTNAYNSNLTKNFNIHFDWINDLKLVNNDKHLISCSSDLSLKMMSLTSSDSHNQSNNLGGSITSLSNSSNSQPDSSGIIHRFPNIHTDYIKKLSYITPEKSIVSGGLDGKVVIWDLNTLKPINQFQNLSSNSSLSNSIYSLANNNSNLIGAGGPNNTINLFDKRINNDSSTSSFVRKLIGHQDNIRCLLMNDRFALSGSSDTTIKLWDLRNFKVYKNFDFHDDAIWSLTTGISSSPGILDEIDNAYNTDFTVFYSGDKSGNIIKTDLSYHSPNITDDIYPGYDTFNSNDINIIDEKLGISTLVAKSNNPIISLCVESSIDRNTNSRDETSLFASNNMSLNRFYIPSTDQLSRYQYLRTCLDHSINRHDNLMNDELTSGLIDGGGSETNDLNSDFFDIVSHLSMDTDNLDLQSSFSGNNHSNYPLSIHHATNEFGNDNNADDNNEYTSMFFNVNGVGPSMEFVNAYKEELWDNEASAIDPNKSFKSSIIDETPIEILLNPISVDQVELIPFNKEPFDKFQLTPKSIISKRLFNNKRWMIVLYLNGDIKIWDIFMCKVHKVFPLNSNEQSLSPMTKDLTEKRVKEMEIIFQDFQTTDTLNNWCEVEIKSGKLLVTLKESSFNNVEIYYDELISQYPYLDFNHRDNIDGYKNKKVKNNEDDRLQLSKIFLNSIFHAYALYEWEFDYKLREDLKTYKPKIKSSLLNEVETNSNGNSVNDENSGTGSITPSKRMKMFSRKSSKNNVNLVQESNNNQEPQPNSPAISAISTNTNEIPTHSLGDFPNLSETVNENDSKFDNSHTNKEINELAGVANDDSILKLLQFNKRRYVEKYNSSGKSPKLVDSLLKLYSNDPKLNESYKSEEFEIHKPLIHPQRLPLNLLIIVFEHSSELGNYRDVCSFHFEDLIKLNYHSHNVDKALINDLRNHLPKWIGQPILYDHFPTKDSPKIAFQLLEIDYSLLPIDKKIGGKSQRKIKKLPVLESSIKLTSHNMLRVSKILAYLTEKFDSRTTEMKDRKPPTEWLVLECKGEELPNNMTLQTIKTKIWKSSSDIELRFRRKFDK